MANRPFHLSHSTDHSLCIGLYDILRFGAFDPKKANAVLEHRIYELDSPYPKFSANHPQEICMVNGQAVHVCDGLQAEYVAYSPKEILVQYTTDRQLSKLFPNEQPWRPAFKKDGILEENFNNPLRCLVVKKKHMYSLSLAVEEGDGHIYFLADNGVGFHLIMDIYQGAIQPPRNDLPLIFQYFSNLRDPDRQVAWLRQQQPTMEKFERIPVDYSRNKLVKALIRGLSAAGQLATPLHPQQ